MLHCTQCWREWDDVIEGCRVRPKCPNQRQNSYFLKTSRTNSLRLLCLQYHLSIIWAQKVRVLFSVTSFSFSFRLRWWIDLSIFRSFILSIFSVSTPPRNPKSIDSQIFSFEKRRREPVPVCVPLPNFWRPCKRSRALSSSKRRKQTWLNWFIFGFRLCFFHSFLSSLLFIVVRALQRLPLDIWVKQTASAEAEKKKCASERPLSTPQLAFSNLRSDILPSHWKCDCPKRKSIGQYDQCCTVRSVDESEMMS